MKRIKISKEQYNLLKENFPKVKGGLNRVDKLFKKGDKNKIFENQMDYIRVSDDFLKYLYIDEIKKLVKKGELNLDVEKIKYPRDLENKDITFDKLANELEKQGVLVKDVETQRYLVDDSLTKEKAMSEIEDTIRTLIGDNFNKLFSRASKKFVSQFKPKNIYENNDLVIEKLDEGKCSLRYKDTDDTYDVNESILNELAKIYEKDKKLMSIIEAEFPELWGKYKKSIEKARTKPETKKTRDELVKAIQDIRKKELDKRELEKDDDTIDEVTTAASSGQFTALLFSEPIKRKIVPVVYETTQGTDSVGAYDANALINIGRDGQFKPAKKTKAQTKTQYPDGGFVEFNDCVKLNNKPAGSGCSSGAIDNVVKVKKTKGNIISPSLNESLKLQLNKENNELIVISDLEGKAASQETFSNKNVLKQNGFKWNGTNWVISSDKLNIAKQTLTLINKAEYLIDKLEDLEEAVDNSDSDKKSSLKAKLEMYINDLANATDEKALSAEIRRYLTFFSKFHDYSFYNRMLIFIQNPEATRVASYKKWQEKNRQVKRGAKAISILAPIINKSKAGDEDKDDVDIRQNVNGFRAVNVFDISDTEATSPEGEIPMVPQWWGENTPSETAEELFGYVSEVASDMAIKVTKTDSSRGEKGFAAGDHINISSDVEGVGKLSTMIHEIAHELMHFKSKSIYYQDDEVRSSSALKELQAESVSYVVLKHYGLPVSHHTTYLALWKANKEKIQNNLEVISKVSQFIIDRIDEEVERNKKKTLTESINNEIEFKNWVTPDETTLKREFYVEHKLKGNNFFESEEEFLNAVKNGSIITLTNDDDKRLNYRSRTKTKDSLLGLIRTYGSYPEFRNEDTVEAIYDGYKNNTEMELPIVIEFNNGRRRIFSGNTRLDIAFQLGIVPKVLLIKSNV
jgi:hypothetical protein